MLYSVQYMRSTKPLQRSLGSFRFSAASSEVHVYDLPPDDNIDSTLEIKAPTNTLWRTMYSLPTLAPQDVITMPIR